MMDPDVGVAMSDPLRLGILAVATQRSVSASEYAKEVGLATSVVAYHFRVLRDRGFLELVETIPVRGSTKYMYRATKPAYISDKEWAEMAHSVRPGVVGKILQELNGRVVQAVASGTLFDRSDACLYWAPRALDDKAWVEAGEAVRWCIGELQALEADTLKRIETGETSTVDSFPSTFAIGLFPSPAHGYAPKAAAARQGKAGKGKR